MSRKGLPFASFPITASLKLDPSDILDLDPHPDPVKVITRVKPPNKNGPSGSRRTFMVNFAGTKFRKYAVWWPAPLWVKARIIVYFVTGQKLNAARVCCMKVYV